MFEKIIASIVTPYASRYFENFNAQSLSVSLWGGDILLHDLIIRSTVFDDLGLPFEVTKGIVQTLVIKVPWHALRSQPVVVELVGVHVICSQKDPQTAAANAQADKEKEKQRKTQALAAFESARIAKETAEIQVGAEPGMIARLTEVIVNNIQIRVKGIHIRLEDPGISQAFGLCLDSLEVLSVNRDGVESFSSVNEDTVYKRLKLTRLYVYGDKYERTDPDLWIETMNQGIKSEMHSYIVFPINTDVCMSRVQSEAVRNLPVTQAQMELTAKIPSLGVNVETQQYHAFTQVVNNFTSYKLKEKYASCERPKKPVKGNAREWIRYLKKAVMNSIREEHMKIPRVIRSYLPICEDYKTMYIRKLRELKGIPVTWNEPLPMKKSKKTELDNVYFELIEQYFP
eukprot:PhF_6_TR27938/c0_g1_i1/m.41162